jgi:hypothetical protein
MAYIDKINIELDDVYDLLNQLKLKGFLISTGDYVKVSKLLIALASYGKLPGKLNELLTLLSPIVCRSKYEQEIFVNEFNAWILYISRYHEKNAITLKQCKQRNIRGKVWPPKNKLSIAFDFGLIIVIIAFCISNKIDCKDNKKSIAAPEADTLYPAIKIDKNIPLHEPPQIAAVRGQLDKDFGNTRVIQNKEINWNQNERRAQLKQLVENINKISATPEDKAYFHYLKREIDDHFNVISIIWGSSFFIILIILILSKIKGRRTILGKYAGSTIMLKNTLYLKKMPNNFIANSKFRQIYQGLRRRRLIPSSILNVEPTVNVTINEGGLFTPVFKMSKILIEYVILLDRKSYNDHFTHYIDEILNHLIQNEVPIKKYYFNDDPRICKSVRSNDPATNLSDLYERFPNDKLIMFSDCNCFFNALSGHIHPWIDLLSRWEVCTIFTPLPFIEWYERENVISRLKFIQLFPATISGFSAFVASFQGKQADKFNLIRNTNRYPAL